jgi:hypothetical protein
LFWQGIIFGNLRDACFYKADANEVFTLAIFSESNAPNRGFNGDLESIMRLGG